MLNTVLRHLLDFVDFIFDQAVLSAARLNLIERYQPIFGDSNKNGERACIDRWQKIEPHLPRTAFSFLDIGSQLGFFTLSAARHGAIALGIERVMTFYRVAEAARRQSKIKSAAFLNIEFNQDSLGRIPAMQVVCFMSVFHHWVNDWGEQVAVGMLRKLCDRTQMLIFETGQPDEEGQNWTKNVEFMNPNPKIWIEEILRSCGFNKINYLGEFPTHLSRIPRHLFIASKGT